MISDGESSMGTASRIQPVTEMPYRMQDWRGEPCTFSPAHGRLRFLRP